MAFNRAETGERARTEEAVGAEGSVRCAYCSRPLRVAFIKKVYGWHAEVVCIGCDRSEPHCDCL